MNFQFFPDTNYFSFGFDEINFDLNEVYRLMHLEAADENDLYHSIIEREISVAEHICEIRGGYRLISDAAVKQDIIMLDNRILHTGKNTAAYMKKAGLIAVFVCTAGKEIELHSRKLMKEGHLLDGYISDVIGTVVVESAMDVIHERIRSGMKERNLMVSNRYSPGYCNWDVADQKNLFALLPPEFCGISLSESCLMSPIKSVSGIIGIGRDIKFRGYVCDDCANTDCIYRDIKIAGK